MFENQSINQTIYFKQYPCYQFAIFNTQNIRIKNQFNCAFQYSSQKLKINMPAALVDSNVKVQTLYLLQWIEYKQNVVLFLKTLNGDSWTSIGFNYFPDFLTISGSQIFAVGGRQLFLFNSNTKRTMLRHLQYDRIVSINPIICHKQEKEDIRFEPGVNILYETQRNQFYCSNQSEGIKQVKKPQFINKAVKFLFKNDKIIHLEVLVPNILGLAFLQDQRMCVYDLSEMRILKQYSIPLKYCQKSLIRWKQHTKKSINCQSFFILVSIEQFIYSFSLDIYIDPLSLDQNNSSLPISSFLEASMVDWNSIKLNSYLTFVIEGKILLDMQISTKGLIYFTKQRISDQIGQCKYLDLKKLLNQATIMTQESNIWRLYYEDKWMNLKLNQDRLLMPNRYSYNLVSFTQESKSLDLCSELQILNQWKNRFNFSSFVTFGEQLLIVRAGSLSLFRNINEQVFEQEYLNSQMLEDIEPEYLNAIKFQSLGIAGTDNKRGFNLRVCKNRQTIQQRVYHGNEQDLDILLLEKKRLRLTETIQQIKQIIATDHVSQYHNLVVKQLQQNLICQLVRDKISSYYQILANNVYKYDQLLQNLDVFNELYEKNSLTAKIIQYFNEIYHRTSQQYKIFGSSLIDLFIKRQNHLLSDDIDYSVLKILQMLFTNIIPEGKGDIQDYSWFSNQYVDFLLKELKDSWQKNQQQTFLFIKQELSRLLSVGFFQNENRFTVYFMRNKSLLKGLFVSYNSFEIENLFQKQLTKQLQVKQTYQSYLDVKQMVEFKQNTNILKILSKSLAKHHLDLDISDLNFDYELPNGADQQTRQKYQKVSMSILEQQTDFETVIQKTDTILLSGLLDEPIRLGQKKYDI